MSITEAPETEAQLTAEAKSLIERISEYNNVAILHDIYLFVLLHKERIKIDQKLARAKDLKEQNEIALVNAKKERQNSKVS
jgi:hypothetical protein